jgi:hypothetical protein
LRPCEVLEYGISSQNTLGFCLGGRIVANRRTRTKKRVQGQLQLSYQSLYLPPWESSKSNRLLRMVDKMEGHAMKQIRRTKICGVAAKNLPEDASKRVPNTAASLDGEEAPSDLRRVKRFSGAHHPQKQHMPSMSKDRTVVAPFSEELGFLKFIITNTSITTWYTVISPTTCFQLRLWHIKVEICLTCTGIGITRLWADNTPNLNDTPWMYL